MVPDIIVLNELERLIINLNHTAMEFLRNDQFSIAIGLLNKAESNLLQVDDSISQMQESVGSKWDNSIQGATGMTKLNALKNRLLGLTYNNLGCLAKQQQDYLGALEYLKKALIYESTLEDNNVKAAKKRAVSISANSQEREYEETARLQQEQYINSNTSGTILNICAILSKLNRHSQAYEYAMQAITNLKKSLSIMRVQITKVRNRLKQDNTDLNQNTILSSQEAALQTQWVNIATTTVIAYYNAAVESEFTGQWKEALELYQEALYLSQRAMNQDNPMTPKIQMAIAKVKVKVRNKVQLPSVKPKKSLLQNLKRNLVNPRAKHHSVSIQTSVTSRYQTKGAIMTDFQPVLITQKSEISQENQIKNGDTPCFDTNTNCEGKNEHDKIKSGEARLAQIQDSLMSDGEQYTERDVEFNQRSKQTESKEIKYYGNSEAINIKQMSMFKSLNDHKVVSNENYTFNTQQISPKLRLKMELSPKNQTRRDKSIISRKSPMSLKQIINKLEKQQITELQPVNSIQYYRNNRNIQTVDNCQERNLIADRPKKNASKNNWMMGNHHDCSSPFSNKRFSHPRQKMESKVGRLSNENQSHLESGFAPQLFPKIQMPPSSAGIDSARTKSLSGMRFGAANAVRGFIGAAATTQRQTVTNFNKKNYRKNLKSDWMKGDLSSNVEIESSELPASINKSVGKDSNRQTTSDGGTKTGGFDLSVTQNEIISYKDSLSNKILSSASQIRNQQYQSDQNSTAPQSCSFRVSPISLQVALSQEEERRQRYLEQKSLQDKKKHEREVKFYSDHFVKQVDSHLASVYSKRTSLGLSSMVQEVNSGRQKSNFRQQYEQISQQIAAAVYLPDKLKKAVKKHQVKSQLKEAIRLRDELNEKAQELRLNQQLEQAFQQEMTKWKNDQDQVIELKIKAYEEERQIKEAEEKEKMVSLQKERDLESIKEIERLNEYARIIEQARKEAERLLIEKQIAEKLQKESMKAASLNLKDNDAQTDCIETENIKELKISLQVQRVDQITSTQGLNFVQQQQQPSQFEASQSQIKSHYNISSINESQQSIQLKSIKKDGDSSPLNIITGQSEICEKCPSRRSSHLTKRDFCQVSAQKSSETQSPLNTNSSAQGGQIKVEYLPTQSRVGTIQSQKSSQKIDQIQTQKSFQSNDCSENGYRAHNLLNNVYEQSLQNVERISRIKSSINDSVIESPKNKIETELSSQKVSRIESEKSSNFNHSFQMDKGVDKEFKIQTCQSSMNDNENRSLQNSYNNIVIQAQSKSSDDNENAVQHIETNKTKQQDFSPKLLGLSDDSVNKSSEEQGEKVKKDKKQKPDKQEKADKKKKEEKQAEKIEKESSISRGQHLVNQVSETGEKDLITFGTVRVCKKGNSNENQIFMSSEAISEMIAKVNSNSEDHDQSNFFNDESYVPSERNQKEKPQYSSIQSVEDILEKRTLTDATDPRQPANRYDANIFADISIVCEEEISNWQLQHIGTSVIPGGFKINEIEEDESLNNSEQTEIVRKKNSNVFGEGPIFIQRKTSYRIKEEWESQNESKMTMFKTKVQKPSFLHDIGGYGATLGSHDLTQRPLINRNQTSNRVQEQKKININVESYATNQYALTLKHISQKHPDKNALKKVKTQTKVHDEKKTMADIFMSKRASLNQDLIIRQSVESKTDETEYAINPMTKQHLLHIQDSSYDENILQSKSDISEVTQQIKNAQKQQKKPIQRFENSQSSYYTNIKPVLHGSIVHQCKKIQVQNNIKELNLRTDITPKQQHALVKVSEYSLHPEINQDQKQLAQISDIRFAKIAGQIQKLNLQLEQFQNDLQKQRADPVLKSTRRSEQTANGSIKSETPHNKMNNQQKRIQSEMQYGQAMKVVNAKHKQLPKLTIFTKASFSSNISQSTLPQQIRKNTEDFKETFGDQTDEAESVQDVLSVDNTLSLCTHKTNAQRMPTQKNVI